MINAGCTPPEYSRIVGHDNIGLFHANQAGNIAPQFEVRLQFTIRVTQKNDFFDAQNGSGITFFILTNFDEALMSHFGITAALVAAGCQDKSDVRPFCRPTGKSRATKKFRVVGMSKNAHHTLHRLHLGCVCHVVLRDKSESVKRDTTRLRVSP
jgi:hypothetical protein